MPRIKGLKFYILVTILIVLGLIVGPNLKWLSPSHWWGQTLVVLMNENEARPCGGFVTAFGVVNLPFGGVELNNSFAFPDLNLGPSKAPLNRVSAEQKFWDLGTHLNLNHCGQEFVSAFERASGTYPDRVLLVQSSLVENYIEALGPLKVGDIKLSADNFFSLTSRLVADIDRHDEAALEARKNPLHLFGKRLMVKTLTRPWRWHALSRAVYQAEQDGELYIHIPGTEQLQRWQQSDIGTVTISEWNLGGAKSSRYLDKHWRVMLKQTAPQVWELEQHLAVTHLGQEDRPLSQTWQGGFEMKAFGQPTQFVSATINPGETFTHKAVFEIPTKKLFTTWKSLGGNLARVNLYAPPYQNWDTKFLVSGLAQQQLVPQTQNLKARESTARWSGTTSLDGEAFGFTIEPDTLPPFLTWHKPLASPSEAIIEALNVNPGDVVVELHFNERVQIPTAASVQVVDDGWMLPAAAVNIALIDRDYAVSNNTENLAVSQALLLADKTTMLFKVRPSVYQPNERYYLRIEGISDVWGNTNIIENRTVITR